MEIWCFLDPGHVGIWNPQAEPNSLARWHLGTPFHSSRANNIYSSFSLLISQNWGFRLHGVYLISTGHDPWTFRPFMAPLDPPGLCESFGKSFQGMFTAKKMTFATAGTYSAPPICPLPSTRVMWPNPNSCFWTSGYLKSYRWWSWDLEVP